MASKNMRLWKKIERAKLSQSYSRNATDLRVNFEIKLNKLRANNRSLAKALADQKQETKLWYDEVISLKGQLQEAQERLAETRDNGFEGAVETEVLRRIQEHSEPLNTAMNAAMENMVVVIDNFSKVKQLVGTLTRGVRNRSTSYLGSSSSSKVSLPKSSGPRDPMKSNSGQVTLSSNVSVSTSGNNWTSTRYHRVLPMVEGHTLQPAMVAIPKVDIQELWKRKQEERAQVNQEGDMAISVIEEQNSSLEISRPDSTYNQQQDEENLEESETTEDARNTSDASDTLPSSADPSTHELPFEELSPTRYQDNIFGEEFSRTFNGNNFASKQKENAEARCKEENLGASSEESQEDPLEGPSWRFINIEKPVSKSGRRKSSVAARKSSPGSRRRSSARIGGQKNRRGRRASVQVVLQDAGCNANNSQVLETSLVNNVNSDDGAVVGKSNSEGLPSQNANDNVATANGSAGDLIQENIQESSDGLLKDTSLNVGDASYLASPATMLARLEDLETKRGRKSRSRSTRNSGNIPRVLKHPSEVGSPTVKLRRLSSEEIHSSMFMKERLNDDALPINGSDSYGISETDSALPLPPPLACSQNLASLPCDYLITDQDLTCVMNVTMEITEPVSKLIPQISQEPVTAATPDEKTTKPVKEVTENKKFFKPRTKEVQENSRTPSKDSENSIKTPFDLSLMESTMVMPPYVSTKSEKENIHPSMTNILDDDDVKEGRKSLKMVNVSVVLEDVMRTTKMSEHLQSHMQSLSAKELPEDSKAILESPRERKKKGSNQENAGKKSFNSSLDPVEDDIDWLPPVKKGQRNAKREDEKSYSKKHTLKSSKLSVGTNELVKKRPRKSKADVNFDPEVEVISEISVDKINSSFTKGEAGGESFIPVKDTFSPKKKYKAAAASTKNQDEKNTNRNENVTKFAKPVKPRGRPSGRRKRSKESRSVTPKPSPEVTPNTTLEATPNALLESSVQNEESLPVESNPADLKVERRKPVKRPKVRSKSRISVGKPKKRKTKNSELTLTNGVDEALIDLVDISSQEVNSNLNSTEPQNSNIGLEDALLDLNTEVVDTSVDKSLDQKSEDTQNDQKLSIENKNNMCQSSEPPNPYPLLDVKKEFGDDLESLLRKIKQVTDSDKVLEDGEVLPDLGAITFSEEEDKNKNSNQRKNLMTGIEAINSLNALECVEELADQGLRRECNNKEEEKNSILEAKKSIDVADLKIEIEEENREHRRRRTTAVTSYKERPLNCKMRQDKENTVSINLKPQVGKSKS